MKQKSILFILFALISISANSMIPLYSSDEDNSPVIYEESVPQVIVPTSYQIIDAWEVFIGTLPESEQVQLPAQFLVPDTTTINELIEEQQTVVQQTLQLLQEIMRRMYETVRGVISNLR